MIEREIAIAIVTVAAILITAIIGIINIWKEGK